jgi:hypothetical protein
MACSPPPNFVPTTTTDGDADGRNQSLHFGIIDIGIVIVMMRSSTSGPLLFYLIQQRHQPRMNDKRERKDLIDSTSSWRLSQVGPSLDGRNATEIVLGHKARHPACQRCRRYVQVSVFVGGRCGPDSVKGGRLTWTKEKKRECPLPRCRNVLLTPASRIRIPIGTFERNVPMGIRFDEQ